MQETIKTFQLLLKNSMTTCITKIDDYGNKQKTNRSRRNWW